MNSEPESWNTDMFGLQLFNISLYLINDRGSFLLIQEKEGKKNNQWILIQDQTWPTICLCKSLQEDALLHAINICITA